MTFGELIGWIIGAVIVIIVGGFIGVLCAIAIRYTDFSKGYNELEKFEFIDGISLVTFILTGIASADFLWITLGSKDLINKEPSVLWSMRGTYYSILLLVMILLVVTMNIVGVAKNREFKLNISKRAMKMFNRNKFKAQETKSNIIKDVAYVLDTLYDKIKYYGDMYEIRETRNIWTGNIKDSSYMETYKTIVPNYDIQKQVADDIYIYFPSFIPLVTQAKDTKDSVLLDKAYDIVEGVINTEYDKIKIIVDNHNDTLEKAQKLTNSATVVKADEDLEYFKKHNSVDSKLLQITTEDVEND